MKRKKGKKPRSLNSQSLIEPVDQSEALKEDATNEHLQLPQMFMFMLELVCDC